MNWQYYIYAVRCVLMAAAPCECIIALVNLERARELSVSLGVIFFFGFSRRNANAKWDDLSMPPSLVVVYYTKLQCIYIIIS